MWQLHCHRRLASSRCRWPSTSRRSAGPGLRSAARPAGCRTACRAPIPQTSRSSAASSTANAECHLPAARRPRRRARRAPSTTGTQQRAAARRVPVRTRWSHASLLQRLRMLLTHMCIHTRSLAWIIDPVGVQPAPAAGAAQQESTQGCTRWLCLDPRGAGRESGWQQAAGPQQRAVRSLCPRRPGWGCQSERGPSAGWTPAADGTRPRAPTICATADAVQKPRRGGGCGPWRDARAAADSEAKEHVHRSLESEFIRSSRNGLGSPCAHLFVSHALPRVCHGEWVRALRRKPAW